MEASGSQPRAREEIRRWEELREQIKSDLEEAHRRHETLTHMNKLLILRNFATLRIKDTGRIAASKEIARQWHEGTGVHFTRQIRFLARHYQLFEQVTEEKRGTGGGRSLLKDERVQAATRAHLSTVPKGEVTPKGFHRALNERILPSLGFALKAWLSERTARRWLISLGWRRTRVKKGVYMDGHERPDVVKYRNNIFLPLMASFERRMVQWRPEGEGAELVCIEPDLGPEEKRVIAVFQDESSFHVNDHKQTSWYALCS
jgi:hypothetical protein